MEQNALLRDAGSFWIILYIKTFCKYFVADFSKFFVNFVKYFYKQMKNKKSPSFREGL